MTETAPDPILTVSDAAIEKLERMKEAGRLADSALRVSVSEEGAAFLYQIEVVELETQEADDTVVPSRAVDFLVDAGSLPRLRGATLDYADGLSGAGFKFQNPNQPALLAKPLAGVVQKLLDEKINPGVAAHGGRVSLVDIEAGRVVLQFGGGCQGCGMIDVTLKEGIEKTLKLEIPEITEVVDVTDHTSGENPYF
jgi:Fe/S biogenesis protein NfuA